MKPENLRSSFTKRYIIAISLIAFLSSGAFYILYLALKTSDTTALIVNISGKQRMLSQRVASFSQQYYLHAFNIDKSNDINTVQSSLMEVIQEMKKANQALSSGRLNEEVTVELSKTISNVYFGDQQLKQRVDTYLLLAQQITEERNQEKAFVLLQKLLTFSNPLLKDLNGAVLQYQKEGEDNITTIRHLESTAWILTLFTLIMEILFIFQPMANKIQDLFQELTYNQQNLEQQIEIRTLSLESANDKLLHIASHDPLTGLKNRLNLEQDLEALIDHHREHHSPYAVAMLDIDWFKKINDSYGHDVGDFVLCEIAKILKENIREEDSVYRAGGEEFVLLFNRLTHEEALKKTNQIRLSIQEHLFVFNALEIHVTISGGLYHPDIIQANSVQKILKFADVALYKAKDEGRNRIVSV